MKMQQTLHEKICLGSASACALLLFDKLNQAGLLGLIRSTFRTGRKLSDRLPQDSEPSEVLNGPSLQLITLA